MNRLCCGLQGIVFQLFLFVSIAHVLLGQVRYSIPEEMATGSVVGNIVVDLGLDINRLKSGRARIFTEDDSEYIGLNSDKGTLVVAKIIDREVLCGQLSPCSLHFQIILDNPMELHRIDVEIVDINDNAPAFAKKEIHFEISEMAVKGSRFSLDSAKDPDVSLNTLQTYKLNPTDHFKLNMLSRPDGTKYVEMVLETSLDREKQDEHKLILTAYDGGNPQKSGSVKINVIVVDANDNAPVFSHPVFRVNVPENALKGSVILKVSATDMDQGPNGEIVYFSQNTNSASSMFNIDTNTGKVTMTGALDYEKAKHYEIDVEAKDKGGLTDTSKILIDVIDVNDNAPIINIISFSNPIAEDSVPETVIAMLNIKDLDSGKNGQVKCFISPDLPFTIKSDSSNFYRLVTDNALDREIAPEYNITVTATDGGSPPFSVNKTITLKISDVNDNTPLFSQQSLIAYISENNLPGKSVLSVKANDKDVGNNARISYFLNDNQVNEMLTSAYFSVNAESGEIMAVRSFDYEQRKEFTVSVKAQDGGSPPLSSNVSVKILIQDQNDNAPQVLYPVQTGGSLVAEMVPRSADVGYLVTKVVAVDVDSGQNAWLSYKLQKATDRALFEVGLQNGEIRTIRQVTDKDAVKQRLTVIVEDNGQPSRSATVIVNVAVADSFPEVLSEFTDLTHDKEYNDNLTFYLVLALAVVSFLFITCLVVIISVKIYRWRHERHIYKSGVNLPVIPYYPPLYADVGTGTLKHAFNYDVCGTTDTCKSQLTDCIKPFNQSTLNRDHNVTQTMSRSTTHSVDLITEVRPRGCLHRVKWKAMHFIDRGKMWRRLHAWQVLLWWHHFFLLWSTIDGQARYTIPEELKQGSVVGNISKDLGLAVSELYQRKLRITSEAGKQYFTVDLTKGELVVSERIDREGLCGPKLPCLLPLEVVIENPLQLHRVDIEIQDINDNSPEFATKENILKIAELVNPGARFPLENARDPDVGSNSVRSYVISKNDHFRLNVKNHKDGSKIPELILEKSLDREKQPEHRLILTAVDGGESVRSGTSEIIVTVIDNNDNAPQFERQLYEINVTENTAPGTELVRVKATDADEGLNGEIEYFFREQTIDSILALFDIEHSTGAIVVKGDLDYEETSLHKFDVVAKDKGNPEMDGHCAIEIKIIDINDNTPEIIVTSITTPIQEDSAIGTVVALISAKDPDSGDNGKVKLSVSSNSPFKLNPSVSNHYTLITRGALDRENNGHYNVKITAVDLGKPSLSSEKMIGVDVLDVNDNPPVFSQSSYTVHVKENCAPGKILYSVSATDLDYGENAKLSYSILDSKVQDVSVSSYVYINSDNGSIYSMHSFDYEKLKVFQIQVQAKDHGSPSLSSNATVHVFILDQNDNAPAVIYPSSAVHGSLSQQRTLRSSKAGHLVTKVTAVDADSGHNAWISYRLAEATDASLFAVNLYTGEVRTKRAVSEQDDSSQRLLIEIKDDGDPVQSTTVTVSILLEDGLHEPILDLRQKTDDSNKKTGRITLYLILSLASVSVLSLVTFLILAVKCLKSSRSSGSCCMRRSDSEDYKNPNRNLQIQLNTDGPIKYVEVLGGDMLSQSQSFRSCLSPMSEYSDFTFVKPSSTTDFKDMINVLDASLPDSTWTFESQQYTYWIYHRITDEE
ncbi:Protocadherin gamma-C5 [Merluccius polli]|uniref:Protocadherin gamma-C5 n=1 Tax=Merluccius polli TaxID=89951 RepID=A0AA47P1J7_MERPO|nr:Protocadherin gamma-C5 [Merluccius polli]